MGSQNGKEDLLVYTYMHMYLHIIDIYIYIYVHEYIYIYNLKRRQKENQLFYGAYFEKHPPAVAGAFPTLKAAFPPFPSFHDC